MAYKSRVTNQYMGATFAGQVQSSNKSDVTDLVNILQKDVNPALAKIADKYVETKKDVAKEKINQLFLSKDAKTIQQEILDGKHPELSNQYVQKTVSLHTGKHEAARVISEIEKNKNNYDFKTGNLASFYKQYLPNFDDKDGSYALGFASIFNEYKADEAIKDAVKRNKYAQEQKIQQGVAILDTAKVGEVIVKGEGLQYDLPPDEYGNKRRKFYTNDEVNDVYIAWAENRYNTATKPEQIDEALVVLKSNRKVDKDGKVLVGSLESTKRKDVAVLIGKLNVKRTTLENQSRIDKEFQIKQKKTDIWLKSISKKEDGTMPTINDIQALAEEYKKIDASDIKGYQNFIKWHSTNPKDRVIADPAVTTKFKLNIARGVYESHDEMIADFISLGIQGDPESYTTRWSSAENARGKGKPIFDRDTNYVSSKSNVKELLKELYPKDQLGNTKYFRVWDKTQDWMDEQILDKEEEWKAENKTPSSADRRAFAIQLKKDALEIFSPSKTGGGTQINQIQAPSTIDLRNKEEKELQNIADANADAARRQQVLNTVVSSVDSGDGNIIETTVGDVINNISNNIQAAGKQELSKIRIAGIIDEKQLFSKVNQPKITKFIKNVLGTQFNEDVLAALPQQDYNNIVNNIANSFNLIKKVPKGAKNKNEIIQQNRETFLLINSIIQNLITGE